MRTWIAAALALTACSAPAPRPAPSPAAPPPSAPPTAAAPDPTPPAFRLPTDVRPTGERVELTIVPGQPRATGAIHIDATVLRATRAVWLNAADLHVHGATLGGRPARVIEHGDVVGLVADGELPAGPLAIDAAFEAPIDAERSRGMYSAVDGGEPYVYTFFEPIDARRAFPCFDEPSFKIPWTLVFHVREHDVALGNAPVAREVPETGGMKRVELAPTKPLPSYLVAFVVGPFDVVDDGLAGRANTPVRFVVPKGHAEELGFAKQITPRVVGALEDYFDMPYPFVKLDVAVVPRYWGTMEHPGIVAMGQPLTLIRADQDTREREQGYTNILAHELGHYWFGDLVTMSWWDDIWLNEALGEWLDMITTDAVMPAWHYREDRVDIAMRGMSSDETVSAKPIHHEITSADQIEGSFDNDITYFKGASVVRACEAFVGAGTWRDFIRGYIRKHEVGNATASDFVAEMRAVLGPPVATAFDTYIMQPGVPVVSVTCAGDHLAIKKTRSLPAGVALPPTRFMTWPIPVCVRFGDATHARRECTTGDAIALAGAACPTWIEPNDGATGYYRSIVDPKLVDAKSPAKLSPAEKRMALFDLRSMVKREQLGVDVAIGRAVQLAADPDPRVAQTGLGDAQFRIDAFDDAFYAAARAWRVAHFGALARALSWRRAPGDSDEREHLREAALALVAVDDPALAREAARVADEWLATRSKLDNGLVVAALQAAAAHGDAARFDRYVAAAKSAPTVAERDQIVAALGAFRAPELAKKALDVVLGRDFDLRDTWRIVAYEAAQHDTRAIAIEFLKAHLPELLARLRDDEQGWLLSSLAGAACDGPHRDAFAALVTPYAAKFDAVGRALEKSAQCIAELAREKPALERLVHK